MTDAQTIEALRRFLSSEDKPSDLTPLDLLQVVRLLLQKADERDTYLSQGTLATQLCSSEDSIARSQERLAHHDYFVIRKGGYRQRTNLCAVQLDKLPLADLHRTVVTDAARKLAHDWMQCLKQWPKHPRFRRAWPQQWAFVCQKLINRSGGDVQLARKVLNFALLGSNIQFRNAAVRGPGALYRIWKVLLNAYAQHEAQKIADVVTTAVPTPQQVQGKV